MCACTCKPTCRQPAGLAVLPGRIKESTGSTCALRRSGAVCHMQELVPFFPLLSVTGMNRKTARCSTQQAYTHTQVRACKRAHTHALTRLHFLPLHCLFPFVVALIFILLFSFRERGREFSLTLCLSLSFIPPFQSEKHSIK